jgi:hypothetical protein
MVLESVHHLKPGSLNKDGLGRYFRDYKKFFRNFPLDHKGAPIRLHSFSEMTMGELGTWRDHIVDSFTPGGFIYSRFTFLDSSGKPPPLTVIAPTTKQGTKVEHEQASLKRKRTKSKSKKEKQPGLKRLRKGRRQEEEEEEEEEPEADSSYSSDSVSDEEGSHVSDEDVKVDRKGKGKAKAVSPKRNPARRSKAITPKYVDDEEDEESEKQAEPRKAEKSRPKPKPRKLPGSQEQLAKREADALHTKSLELITTSPFLQAKAMKDGTMPSSWMKPRVTKSMVSECYGTTVRY